MNINEPTKPETEPTDKRIVSSPVTFAPIPKGANRVSPVVLHNAIQRPTPVSIAEVREHLAAAESGANADPTVPTLEVEDSFFDVETIAPIEYILKERHKDLAAGTVIKLRNSEGSRSIDATVVQCWQMLAIDLNDEHAKALGYESLQALEEAQDWENVNYAELPITVVQIVR